MFRVIAVFVLWLLSLCIFSISIRWSDGWRISLTGWPEALGNWGRKRNDNGANKQ